MKNEILRMENVCIGDYEPYEINDFRLNLFEGEIVNLIGLSGSGKTVLYHYFMGNRILQKGKVSYLGEPFECGKKSANVRDVICIGARSTLIPNMSIEENIFIITNKKRGRGIIAKGNISYRANLLLSQYAPELNKDMLISQLTPAQCHTVELLRAIESEVKLVVIDDIFQSYGQMEVARLRILIQIMKEKKIAILYESHQQDFMFLLVDRTIIMRKGKNIRSFYKEESNEMLMKQLLIGNDIPRKIKRNATIVEHEVFSCRNISGGKFISNFNFSIQQGEIIGLYDFDNQGNRALVDIILGNEKIKAGNMFLNQELYYPKDIDDAIRKNVGYIPRDMTYVSLIDSMSFQDNLFLPVMKKTSKFGFLNDLSVFDYLGKEYMERMGIPLKEREKKVKYFDSYIHNSILLTRWHLFKPTVLVCVEPYAKADILMQNIVYHALDQLAKEGTAILISSPDMSELQTICDRICFVGKKELEK